VQSIDRGDLAQASRRYLELENSSQRGQLATSKVLTIGDFLLESGKPDLALTVYRRLVAERPGEVNLDRAYLGAGKAMLHKARGETSAYHYFLAAIDLAQTPGVVQEARRYLRMIEDKG
jgi:tetratricopeptide (TPR) repeat protein